jgi:DNA-directed RNA polymerase subunit omega
MMYGMSIHNKRLNIKVFKSMRRQPGASGTEDNVARITIEDCLKRVDNRFKLVHMAAARVRQIREGSEYLVSSPKNEDIVVALRELAAGKVVEKPPITEE